MTDVRHRRDPRPGAAAPSIADRARADGARRSSTAAPTTWASTSTGPSGSRTCGSRSSTRRAAGHQPMVSRRRPLRARLQRRALQLPRARPPSSPAAGDRFASRSDTEVVLRAYEEWGPACVERFNGMFAFAVWDARERELLLARDRFGIKPLYYADVGGRVRCSAPRSRRCIAGRATEPRSRRSASPSTSRSRTSSPTRRSSRACGCSRPGTSLDRARPTSGAPRAGTGTSSSSPTRPSPRTSGSRDVASAFERAVDRQLVSDVPVGSYLSGGMDSASIAAVASRSIPRLMTFTGGFDMSSVERLRAGVRRARRRRGDRELRSAPSTTRWSCTRATWPGCCPSSIWHLEDLRVGMCYQNHYIARLASKFVTVALAGTGGDELFAGYPWRYELVEDARRSGRVRAASTTSTGRGSSPTRSKPDFFSPRGLVETSARAPAARCLPGVRSRPPPDLDPATRALYFEAKTFLHGLLVVEDRVSMANSLEARVPFLDNELVEIARRIPVAAPVRRRRPASGSCARRCAGLLPDEVLEKPKQGFSPPDQSWYRGPTMDYIREMLLDPRTLERGYFQRRWIEQMLDEHASGPRQPPAPDLVAALLRMVEPALHRRRAADPPRHVAFGDAAAGKGLVGGRVALRRSAHARRRRCGVDPLRARRRPRLPHPPVPAGAAICLPSCGGRPRSSASG